MSEATGLFLADIETNDMSAFTAVEVAGSNTFASSSSAAGHGTYGARASFAGTSYQADAYKSFTSRNEAYVRCYFKFSSGFNGDTGTMYILSLRNSTNSWDIRPRLGISAGAVSINRVYYRNDAGAQYTTVTQSISLDTWHYMEIHHKTATSAGANDGVVEVWYDGTRIANITAIDNDTVTVDRLYVGQFGTIIPTNGSILDIDDVKLDSSAIGAYADAGQAVSLAGISATGTIGSLSVDQTTPSLGTVIDHTKIGLYDDIPSEYITAIKEMWISIPGESHSGAYRAGLTLLETINPTYAVSVVESGTPEAQTSDNLRASRATWGDLTHATTWRYEYGEEDWYTSATAIAQTKTFLSYAQTQSLGLAACGFGWCWDETWHNGVTTEKDAVYKCGWAGSSVGGPEGDLAWGLNAADTAITGNSICMDTYIDATQQYIDYCTTNSLPTKVFFTTGPVDGYTGELGYQRHVKHEYIRDYVDANGGYILDYADIISWDDAGSHATLSWTDGSSGSHTYDTAAADNLLNLDGSDGSGTTGYHIGERGALRLGKAIWVMLAFMAGWDGSVTPSTSTGETDKTSLSLALSL